MALNHEQRRLGLGASEIGAVCGMSPYSTAEQVLRQKLGLEPPAEQTWCMRWGQLAEPGILQELREDLGWDIQHNHTALLHRTEPWAFATPDGIAKPEPGRVVLIQCKAPQRKRDDNWGKPGTSDAPAYVVAQVLWEMWVARSNGLPVEQTIVAARFGTRPVQQFPVPWDEGRALWLVEQGRAFWKRVEDARKAEAA